MTKAELIEELKRFSDSAEVQVEVDSITGNISVLCDIETVKKNGGIGNASLRILIDDAEE